METLGGGGNEGVRDFPTVKTENKSLHTLEVEYKTD